jgi:beta-glucuronidase
VPDVFIESMALTPVRSGKDWCLDARIVVRNISASSLARSLSFAVAGRGMEWKTVRLAARASKEFRGLVTGIKAVPWSVATPALYPATAVLSEEGRPVDDLIDRVGFREVRVSGRKILLNGKALRLRGYNRHEDHPLFGCSLPVEAMAHDLDIIRDLGCNCVRTSHYPNDMRFLDLCDERGVYVWEESHAWQTPFDQPLFKEQAAVNTLEMIGWHRNHPSIVLWGCLNECDTKSKAGRKMHACLLGLIKKTDPSRPATYAANHAEGDTCYGLADVVSWNRYDAWYTGGIAAVAPRLEKMLEWLHSPRSRGGSGKPVILSEFGAAGIYGNRQRNRTKWTEEFQSDVLDESLRVYLGHPDVCGALIWQFCDIRIDQNNWHNRPRCHNNKGTVDEYRRPKLCYDIVRRRMREAARRSGA